MKKGLKSNKSNIILEISESEKLVFELPFVSIYNDVGLATPIAYDI